MVMEPYPSMPVALANLDPDTFDKVVEFQRDLDSTFEGFEREITEEALLLMCEVHADQKDRPDGTPYIEHPLGVARNVLNSLENPDFESVVSALLHDSVEDQAQKLAEKLLVGDRGATEQERALRYIGQQFGERVQKTVASLTNPDFEAELIKQEQEVNTENKNRLYAEHVKEAIENPDVLPIKLFDFAENALRLNEVTDPARHLKLARKYAPVVSVFIDRLRQGNHRLKPAVAEDLLIRLEAAHSEMQAFIEDDPLVKYCRISYKIYRFCKITHKMI